MNLRRVLVTAVLVFAVASCRQVASPGEAEPTPPERTDLRKIARPIPPHEAVPGSTARTALLFAHAVPGLGARMEVHEYYVAEGVALTVPMPGESVLEIRSGQFDVQASEMKGAPLKGTIWIAEPNARVVVRATSQLAVLRAISIIRQ